MATTLDQLNAIALRIKFSPYLSLYKGYLLNCEPRLSDSGRLLARVMLTSLGGGQARLQHCLDLEEFDTESEAIAHAREKGMAWVDANASGGGPDAS